MEAMRSSKFISSATRDQLKTAAERTKELSDKLQTQDVIGMSIFFALLPMAFIFEVTFVFSFWFPILSEGWLLRVLSLLYLALNVYLNAFFLMWKGANGQKSDLPLVVKSGFVYCHRCALNSPPRSHHCPVCDKCILRRDHHCSFTACCVGHYNQRYFIAAVANLWVICLFCCYYNWQLLWITLSPKPPLFHYWRLMVPHIALAVGSVSVYQFFVILLFLSSFTTLAFVTYLCGAQLFCLNRGQTRVEFLKGVYAYNLGLWENIRDALGERWPLIFLSPFISSPLQSDGLSFSTRMQMEDTYKQAKYL